MNVKWEDVKADYARKDARIKELEGKLNVALGLSEDAITRHWENAHWSDIPMCLSKSTLIIGMEEHGLSGKPEDYSCAADVMADILRGS